MTPPPSPATGSDAGIAARRTAILPCLTVLRRRADFLRASGALRRSARGFNFQARRRGEAETPAGIRVGFTCSRKVGNAVARNRAKRRLREIARAVLPDHGRPGWDYVLVGRPVTTATVDFAQMKIDLARILDRLHEAENPDGSP